MEQVEEDKKFEEYVFEMRNLFRSEGWKYFINDVETSIKNINSLETTKDSEDLFFKKGQLLVMNNCLNLETQLETLVTQRNSEPSEEV
ncbi:MAG: hypothetical protein CL828_03105 [Crocinitomicaceae bacterium]|nr:hypothetical protein [Crocinitomicaceae bacterium]|tara:strand:+ start:24692 stop:24955 length:264 start_codon:yes stop_codon:yes gene_type:complete